jgi:hypothetical protein
MFPAKVTLKMAVLLAIAIEHADCYYRFCRGLCNKQCSNNTGCLCTNNVKCTEDEHCASIDTCSTPCSLPETHCLEQPLNCYGKYSWKQCERENSWCTDYADVECLSDSGVFSF